MAEDVRTEAIPPRRRSRQRSRFPVPFMTTGTATDLALAFALLPVWWALGVDQLIWLPLALFILAKRWLVEKKLRVERAVLVLLLAFGASYLLSGTFNFAAFWDEDGRINYFGLFNVGVAYVVNAIAYTAAALFLILAADCARREGERKRVLYGLGCMALGAAVVGLLPYLGLPLEFRAPIRYVIPNWVPRAVPLFEDMIERSLTGSSCFFGKEIPRSKSIFFYSTLYATALTITIPVQAYLAWTNRGWSRIYGSRPWSSRC